MREPQSRHKCDRKDLLNAMGNLKGERPCEQFK